jgi:hypothetical protein
VLEEARVPRSLTDLAGLMVSAADFLAAVQETAVQPIWVVDPDEGSPARRLRRDRCARL